MRKFLASAAVSAVCLYSAPSFAASAETEAFVANVRLSAVFLARSSEMAADRTENAGLRTFATAEADESNAIVASLDKRIEPAVAQSVPMNVASNEVVTGRSAAEEPAPLAFTDPVGTGALMPAAMVSLAHIAASKGQAFEALYKSTQKNALRQLAGLYNAYSLTGDDAALKQLSKSELAVTNDRIADLARF